MDRLRRIVPFRQPPLTLVLSAIAVIALATTNSARIPGTVTAIVLSIACLVLPPSAGAAIVIVTANDPHMFRDGAFGAVTPVDLAIAATLVRSVFAASRRRPSTVELFGVGFLLAGTAATAVANQGNATTAFGRVASYVVIGLAVGRALDASGRVRVAQAFVGAAVGQAVAAFAGITPTAPTSFPIGRYLGTLGDPAQFGIPIALAAAFVALSPYITRSRVLGYMLCALLSVAVFGSVTRSAWAVLGTAFLVAVIARASRRRSTTRRVVFAAAGVAIAAAATASVVYAASFLGLEESSATIRSRSIHAATAYLAKHPTRPIGLGTPATITLETLGSQRLLASTFETYQSRWLPYGAILRRERRDVVSGAAALRIETRGRVKQEGTGLSVGGIEPDTPYTLSVAAKIPRGISAWLYIDEYDDFGRWQAYKHAVAGGRDAWTQYFLTWKTSPRTDNVKLYVLIPRQRQVALLIDDARLDLGTAALPFDGRERPPPKTVSVSATYNTWLAVAIALGISAAVFLAAFALGAPAHAYRLGDRATSIALGALLVPSLTENFVYGTSLVTLIWLGGLGLTAAAVPRHAAQEP